MKTTLETLLWGVSRGLRALQTPIDPTYWCPGCGYVIWGMIRTTRPGFLPDHDHGCYVCDSCGWFGDDNELAYSPPNEDKS